MNPIADAHKYINEALEEYGIHDYSSICENEDEFGSDEFGFLDVLVQAVTKHGGKVIDLVKKNPELAQGLVSGIGSSLDSSKKTTKRGRSKIKKARTSARSSKISGNVNEFMKARMDKTKGELQVMMGEMRRQTALAGVTDQNLQLEIVRNGFAKTYYAKKEDPSSSKLDLSLMKKSIHEMDQQLIAAFNQKNQERTTKGLPPLVAGFGQPTIEYRV